VTPSTLTAFAAPRGGAQRSSGGRAGAARRALAVAAALACLGGASAQTVSMGGSLGSRALLVIDGNARSVAVGSSVDGVRLVSVTGNDAIVEVKGQRVTLQLGGAPANLGGTPSEGTGRQIVLTAQSGGHFFTSGLINGHTVRFVVDTGSTNIAMSEAEATRIGLEFKNGMLGYSNTANGVFISHRVPLASVRIGDVQVYNVDATVLPATLPYVLLGNSFLERFQMRRENDQLTLDKRY
jgi:aspartyl protease family protein